jgi:ferredoxin-like protein FixX
VCEGWLCNFAQHSRAFSHHLRSYTHTHTHTHTHTRKEKKYSKIRKKHLCLQKLICPFPLYSWDHNESIFYLKFLHSCRCNIKVKVPLFSLSLSIIILHQAGSPSFSRVSMTDQTNSRVTEIFDSFPMKFLSLLKSLICIRCWLLDWERFPCPFQ